MEAGEERRARNEVTFRAANERIARKAAALGAGDQPVPFLCECPQPTCTDLVFLSLDEYTEIRAHPRQFLARPGHEGSGPGVWAVRSAGVCSRRMGSGARLRRPTRRDLLRRRRRDGGS